MREMQSYKVRLSHCGDTKHIDLDFGIREASTYNAGVFLTNWQFLDFQQWAKSNELPYSIALVAHADVVGVSFNKDNASLEQSFLQRWVFGPYAEL